MHRLQRICTVEQCAQELARFVSMSCTHPQEFLLATGAVQARLLAFAQGKCGIDGVFEEILELGW